MDPRIIVIGYVLFMTVMAVLFYKKHKQFQRYGYLGIFLTTLISNLSIFSPANAIVAILGGRLYNPILVGVVAALGCMVGEILAYDVGSSGTTIMQDKNWFIRVKGYMEKNGFLTIFAVTSIPQPAVNVAGLMAGAIQYPFFKFLIASFSGNWLQHMLLALFGKFTKKVV